VSRLAEQRASLDDLPDHEVAQLIHMINEATSPAIRAARVEAAVLSALAWRDLRHG
jgi:hypothetical protein